MRMDMHIHSTYSSDGSASPGEIIKYAMKNGLDGAAIMDHNDLRGSIQARKIAKGHKLDNFLIVPGLEVSTTEGHVLAYGIDELIPRGLSPEETIDKIHETGGIAVAAHPYRYWSGLGESATKSANFDALEIHNSGSKRSHNRKAFDLAKEMGVGYTGGSDAHVLEDVGLSWTRFLEPCQSIDELLKAIQKKQTRTGGAHRSPYRTAVYVQRSVSLWMGRGFKKM